MEEARIKWVKSACERRKIPVYSADEVIRIALEKSDRCFVGWSGGKCSTVVLHKILKLRPDAYVFFIDTGVEFPETYRYLKDLSKSWNFELHRFTPKTTFWKVAEKHGYPQFRTLSMDQRSKHKRTHQPACCYELKEKTLRRMRREVKMEVNITGIRLAESRTRTFNISQKGQIYFQKNYNFWNCHPIAFWSFKDVDLYFKENNIPSNPLYATGQERTGCWPCTGFKTWKESLARSHPKLYRFVASQVGEPLLMEFVSKDPKPEDPEGCVSPGLQEAPVF